MKLFGNITLHSVPPPGSGLLMSFIMKLVESYGLSPLSLRDEKESVATYQIITEAFKHAYAQRTHLGDPYDENVAETVKKVISYYHFPELEIRVP